MFLPESFTYLEINFSCTRTRLRLWPHVILSWKRTTCHALRVFIHVSSPVLCIQQIDVETFRSKPLMSSSWVARGKVRWSPKTYRFMWESWISAQTFEPIFPVDEIFHRIRTNFYLLWCSGNTQGLTKVRRIYPRGTMNICVKFQRNPFDSCWDISTKVVERQTCIDIPGGIPLAWLKM